MDHGFCYFFSFAELLLYVTVASEFGAAPRDATKGSHY